MATREDLILEIKAEMDQLRAALSTAAGDLRVFGDQARKNVGGAFREASDHAGTLYGKLLDLKREGTQHYRVWGYFGSQLASVGVISKGLATNLVGLAGSLASGMWLGAAIEGVKLIAEAIKDTGKEAKKLEELRVKFRVEGEQDVQDSITRLGVAKMRAEGATEEQIRAYELSRKASADQNELLLEREKISVKTAQVNKQISDLEAENARLAKLGYTETGSAVRVLTKDLAGYLLRLGQIDAALQGRKESIGSTAANEAETKRLEKQVADRKKADEKAERNQEAAQKSAAATAKSETEKESRKREEDARKTTETRNKIIREGEVANLSELEKLNRQFDADIANLNEHDAYGRLMAEKAHLQRVGDLQAREAEKYQRNQKRDLNATRRDLEQALRPLQSAMDSVLTGMLDGTKSVTEGMTELWRAMVNAIIAELVRIATQAAITGIIKLVTNLIPGGAGLSGVWSGMGAITGRASGGRVAAGDVAVVGEEGPEVVKFGSAGEVIPNDKLTLGGGEQITNHYHITTLVSKSLEQYVNANQDVFVRLNRRLNGNGRR